MGKTSKLFQLKEWVTLDEAAGLLGELLEERVVVADVLRLVLDGKLVLSVHLVNKRAARSARLVPLSECKWRPLDLEAFKTTIPELPPAQSYKLAELHERHPGLQEKIDNKEILLLPDAVRYSDNDQWLDVDPAQKVIDGVWDLVMIGGDRFEVEKRYQEATRGPEVSWTRFDGVFVQRAGVFFQLLENEDNNPYVKGSRAELEVLKARIHDEQILRDEADHLLETHRAHRKKLLDRGPGYYPTSQLPQDAVWVVRTEVLRALKRKLSEEAWEEERPLAKRRESTLLNIVGGLLGLLLGKSPSGKPLSVFKDQAAVIDALLAEHRGKPGMSQRTLETKFAEAKRSLPL